MGRFDPEKADYATPPVEEAPAASSGRRFAPERHFPAAPDATPPAGAVTSWWDTAKNYGQTADDVVRAAANVLTFGMADRLAGLTGEGTAAEVKKSEAARERSPIASVVGDVAGGVAIPGLGGGLLAARGIQAGLRPAIARAVGYGAEGAAVGAGQGAGTTYSEVPSDYVKNAVTGGALGGALGGTFGSLLGPRNPGMRTTAEVPASPATQRGADYAYGAVRANPTVYPTAPFNALAARLEQQLANYNPQFNQPALNAIEQIRNAQTVTPTSIDVIRQQLNARGGSGVVRRALDDFMVNPPPGSPPTAAEASRIIDQARGLHAGAARTRALENIETSARNATGRGGNQAEKQASYVQSFIDPKVKGSRDRLRGFDPEERAALQRVVTPPRTENVLRSAGDLLSGANTPGGPLAAAAVLGGGGGLAGHYFKDDPVMGTAIGATIPLLGMAMKGGANRMSAKAFESALDLVSKRNPLYAHRLANAPLEEPGKHGSQMLRDAITAGLVGQGFGQVDSVEDEPLRITVNPRR
jgi:hypothetical protein